MKTQGQSVWVWVVWLLLCSVGVWAGQIISPSMKYTMMTGLDARGIVYDAHADRLYAVVIRPEQAPTRYVAVIDPYLGVVERTFGFGEVNVDFSTKYNMALSDDGQYLYIVTHDGHRITRIDLATREVDLRIELPGRDDQTSNGVAYDIVVLPGQPRAVAMTHAIYNATSGMKWTWKVRIYDDNVMRPTEAMVPMTTTQFSVGAQMVLTPEPSVLCLYDQAGGLRRIAVDAAGASLIETIETGWGQMPMKDLKCSGGMVLGVPVEGTLGYVYDLPGRKGYDQKQLSGTALAIDRSLNGVYTASTMGLREYLLFGGMDGQYTLFETNYYLSISGLIDLTCGAPRDMVRFGQYGLAMTTASKQIILGQRKVEPIIYYKMDETSGTVVKNSGMTPAGVSSYHGVLTENLLQPWVTGRWGKALNLDGKSFVRGSSYLSYPVLYGNSRTCTAWIKTTDSDTGTLVAWGEFGREGQQWHFRIGVSGKLEVDVYGGLIQGQMIVNDGKWHHVAAVLPISEAPKVSDIRLYVDGILESMPIVTNPDTLINTAVRVQYLTVGGWWNLPFYTGLLDEVRIYDVALEEAELWRLIWPVPALPAAYWMMDEPSGSGVRDCVGGHDGTLVNATDEMRMAGRNGNALFLDGVDDYVTVPGYKGVMGKSSRTCSAWVKTTKTSGQVVTWGTLGTGHKWVVRIFSSGAIRAEVDNGWIYGTKPVNDGQWHHVAVVLDSDGTPDISEVRLYVDGVRDMIGGVQPCPIDTGDSHDVGIGLLVSQQQPFGGMLDDVRVYDIALDDLAVSALHSSIDKYMTTKPTDPMRDEPVAHWALDETAGTNVSDSLGRHPGKLTNNDGSGAWVDGIVGGALLLDGENDYVTIPEFKGVTGTRSRTCMAWVKTTRTSGQIMSWGTLETGRKWVIRIYSSGAIRAEVENGWVYGTKAVNDGQWHHVAVVLDSDGTPDISEVRLYVDGYLDTTSGFQACPIDTGSSYDVGIGLLVSQQQPFGGMLDDVRIYDYAVSSVVVANQVAPGVVDEPAAYWAMDEASGVEIADPIGGHTGYLQNSDGMIGDEGVRGTALVLDGVDDYVMVPGYKGIRGGASRTCTAWIKTSQRNKQILGWGTVAPGEKWVVRVSDDGKLRVEVQDGFIIGTSLIADGQWHHIAAVLDSDGTPDVSEVCLFVDGNLEMISSVRACPVNTGTEQDAAIGLFAPQPAYYSGLLDEVRIYEYALHDTAIMLQARGPVMMNLEAHWTMDEQSGTRAADSVGGHDGQVIGGSGSSWTLGRIGNALFLDGVDDYVTVPGYRGVPGKISRTCTAWVKTTKTSGQILTWGTLETGRKWVIRIESSGALRAEVQNGWIYGKIPVNDGQWHHVAVVLDSDGTPDVSEIRLYVDGVRDTIGGVQACPIDTGDGHDVGIGLLVSQQQPFGGLLDDVRIYRGALTDAGVMEVLRSVGVVETTVDAGPDQTVYADADGTAEVVLDGGGSTGEDIAVYIWQVAGLTMIDGQPKAAVRLPIGVYTAGLAISDGIMVSQPDEAVIRVAQKKAGVLTMVPTAIRRSDASRYVTAMLKLPTGVNGLDTRLRLSPGDVESAFERRVVSGGEVLIIGWFDKQTFLNAAEDGSVEVTVSGELADGTLVYGKAMVKVGP